MTRAETHADTNENDVTHAKKQIAAKLNDHVGRGNGISAASLHDYLDGEISESTIRDCVIEIRRDYGVPVVSRGSGYYVISDPEEFEAWLDRYQSQIEKKERRKRELTAAWNQHNTGEDT